MSALISFACILAFSLYIEPGLNPASGHNRVMELQLAFHKEIGQIILDAWGAAGREHFLNTVWIDFVFPIAYSTLLAALLARSLHRIRGAAWIQSMIFIPFFVALLDFAENVIEILFVSEPDSISQSLFFAHSIIASFKWGTGAIILIFIVGAGIRSKIQDTKNQ
jgi:hypothetical protein